MKNKARFSVRRGAVMIETVLTLPFVLFILLVLFYMGQNFVRYQHSAGLDRYDAWRVADDSGGAGTIAAADLDTALTIGGTLDDRVITREFPDYTRRLHLSAVGAYNPAAEELAETVMDDLPSGILGRYTVSYPDGPIAGRLNGWFTRQTPGDNAPDRPVNPAITSFHLRLSHPWPYAPRVRYDNDLQRYRPEARPTVDILDTIRDLELAELADRLEALSDRGNRAAGDLYDVLGRMPPYRGPEWPEE